MNNELPDHVKENIQADAANYRDKWTIWKCSLYASLLTTNTLLIGASQLICDTQTTAGKNFATIIAIACLISTSCIIRLILIYIDLYDVMGFIPVIKTFDDAHREKNRQEEHDRRNKYTPAIRKRMDRIALFLSLGGLYLLAYYAIFI
ncbi:hypothetical protein [Pontiella agarivorans]|uniref:DUF3899 domain-containing protein n=1 Tax=Pontiella agarivorans TaxID=3038953 RepID=A0ABU5MS21_9BACT|nr:hypothetical protein [Pontiella agarivorans]MDZ8116993.1 hypothetical protein [Pontiella agarivorans]